MNKTFILGRKQDLVEKLANKETIKNEKKNQIEHLHISNKEMKTISNTLKKEIEKFENLCVLSFENCNLNSLDNFPKLEKLMRLELSRNNIKDGNEFHKISELYPNLISLCINTNPIKKLLDLKEISKVLYLLLLLGFSKTTAI